MDLVHPNDLSPNTLPIYSFFKRLLPKKPIKKPIIYYKSLRKGLKHLKNT